MLLEAETWVAVAFLIFLAIAWKAGAFRTIIQALDSRGDMVRAELDEAKRLREDAAQVLADFERRREEAEREAAGIVAAAQAEAERIAAEAQQKSADFLARRTAAAEAKIARAEIEATAQVRAAAADAAVRASETILREQVRGEAGQELLKRSLADAKAKLHS